MTSITKNQGITLIELMVTIAITGILTSLGYPSYVSHVEDARRDTAKGDLMQLAQVMEDYYSENFTYEGAVTGNADTFLAPNIFAAQSPVPNCENSIDCPSVKYYDLTVSLNSDASAYKLRATPISTSPQAGDPCLIFQYSENGEQKIIALDGVTDVTEQHSKCW